MYQHHKQLCARTVLVMRTQSCGSSIVCEGDLTCWWHHDCRPVDCSTKQVLPFEPGFVSKTIYKDQVGSGWGVGGSAIRRLQDLNQGLSRSNASCFDLQTADVSGQ